MAAVKTPVSPKVKSGANWAALATLALTVLGGITPDMLAFLGNWAPLIYGLVVGGSYALGAYLKSDPLRDYGAVSLSADNAAAVAAVAPAPAPAPARADTVVGPRHRAEG